MHTFSWSLLGFFCTSVVLAGCAKTVMAPTTQVPVQSSEYHDNIYLNKTNASKGAYLSDFEGKALYTFDKDSQGVSACSGNCATLWPPYTSGATAQKSLPAHISVIKRTDGSTQFAWNGKPLYYYAPDKNPGDVTGDGVGGVWHLAK